MKMVLVMMIKMITIYVLVNIVFRFYENTEILNIFLLEYLHHVQFGSDDILQTNQISEPAIARHI